MNLRSTLKSWLPPVVTKMIAKKPDYGFFGFFDSWQDAMSASTGLPRRQAGWDSANVLEKVSESLLKVKNGQAVYERDSVLFDKIQYSWPLLALLLRVAIENENILRVADFGGSLGTTYFQNRIFLSRLKKIEWNIIEQENYVKRGKEQFKDGVLDFFSSIEDLLKEKNEPNLLVVSSVIQYLEKPLDMIKKFLAADFDYIIFDRTSFLDVPDHKIAIQKVKPSIYQAVFPIWFFNYKKFLSEFTEKYEVIAEFPAFIAANYQVNRSNGGDKGFILKKRT